jgi:hypothetical protein
MTRATTAAPMSRTMRRIRVPLPPPPPARARARAAAEALVGQGDELGENGEGARVALAPEGLGREVGGGPRRRPRAELVAHDDPVDPRQPDALAEGHERLVGRDRGRRGQHGEVDGQPGVADLGRELVRLGGREGVLGGGVIEHGLARAEGVDGRGDRLVGLHVG